jgi:hypothetical protein
MHNWSQHHVASKLKTGVMCYYDFRPVLLEFGLPVAYAGIPNGNIEMPDPENMGVAVEILLITCLPAENLVHDLLSSRFIKSPQHCCPFQAVVNRQ